MAFQSILSIISTDVFHTFVFTLYLFYHWEVQKLKETCKQNTKIISFITVMVFTLFA